MIAIKRLQSILWILIIAAGALTAYLVSLRVATERNAVRAVERQIYATRGNIRYLEVEFSARASMSQLARWNEQDIKYSVPTAGQYLADERQLAMLDDMEPSGQAYIAAPVMAAAQKVDAPVMAIPVKVEVETAPARPAPALAKAIDVAAPARLKPAPAVAVVTPAEPRIVRLMDKPDPAQQKRAMRLAQLEATLQDVKAPEPGKAGR